MTTTTHPDYTVTPYQGPAGTHIPTHMMERLRAYIDRREGVGGFLRAVLTNDLKGACGKADSTNLLNLPAYVTYLYNNAPYQCWGSPERVAQWLGEDSDA